jgi:hypothetical protein
MKTKNIIDQLSSSSQPTLQYKTLVNILGEDPDSEKMRQIRSKIRTSKISIDLLSERREDGRIPYHPYSKWYGPHWVLTDLADIYYPAEDKFLLPLKEQEYEWLFSETHLRSAPFRKGHGGKPLGPDRPRIHASMEANAIFSLLRLGLNDEKTDELADRLVKTQWPDGGWNCDRRPSPTHPANSSFHETITPLRALALHAKMTGNSRSREAAKRAAEVFLKRRMYKRQSDGTIISSAFLKLHYPAYWHYDILMGLKVMAETGFIKDRRCDDALDLLESKQLKDGGFPMEARYFRVGGSNSAGSSRVNWGAVSAKHTNEFVTADALFVLNAAGRA